MKPIKKIYFFTLFVLFTSLLTTGCQNILIPYNKPVVLEEHQNSNVDALQDVTIISYDAISSGIVQDISYSGSNLLILNSGNSYSITNLNTTNYQLSPFITSDKPQSNVVYDSYDTGIYYIEETTDNESNTTDTQLIWSDINKNITRIISAPDENVLPNFGIADLGKVVYGNNNNELILSDNNGNQEIYTFSKNYALLKTGSIKNNQVFIFIASDPTATEKTNLYYAEIFDNSNELSPVLIDENVTDFNIDPLNNQVVFIKNSGDYQTISLWNPDHIKPSTSINGTFGTVQFTPDGENIIYTQLPSSSPDSKKQSIWLMNINSQNSVQLTAPIKLNSPIVCHPFKSVLFFSIERNTDDAENYDTRLLSEVYQLVFQLQ